jgi:hypothetical protein
VTDFADWVERELGAPLRDVIAHFVTLRGDDSVARRRLSELPIERMMADVCSGCGGHMEPDPVHRVRLFERGGVTRCRACGVERELKPFEVPADPGVTLVRVQGTDAKAKERIRPSWEAPHLGRFRVLPRTDGLFVVHEDLERGMAFGPVFKSVNEAKWQIWWRVEGEKKTGRRLGEKLFVHGTLVALVDFLDDVWALVEDPETGRQGKVFVHRLVKASLRGPVRA